MIHELLRNRQIPQLRSREEMLEILQHEEYGYIPEKPDSLSFEIRENAVPNFCAGKASCSLVTANCLIKGKEFSFPFYSVIPKKIPQKVPFIIHINFRDDISDRHRPTEELVDNGFAVFSLCYKFVTNDNDDFTDGLAGILFKDGKRSPTDPGKIAMWAWAAQRVMDYAQTLSASLDLSSGIICGHSRLGKTALLTGATDERFSYVYSNDSGCSGAAISRGKIGESVAKINFRFPYWFCENYKKYSECVETMPFDQHFLIASCAPRKVLIGSASEDEWADPLSEQLACVAASEAFPDGFLCDRVAKIGEAFMKGDLAYHLREGLHYFSREDWHRVIEFFHLKSSK